MKKYLLLVVVFNKPLAVEYSWWLNNKPYRKFPHKTFGSIHISRSKLED